jgi:hypothetical protein
MQERLKRAETLSPYWIDEKGFKSLFLMGDRAIFHDVSRLIEIGTIHQFERINGVHIATLIGFGTEQFNPLYQ